jgi:uncharacterized protein
VRIVLDTNVLVSGIFFGGNPGKILHAWRDGKFQIAIFPEIFCEYEEVCTELAQRYRGVDVSRFLDLIKVNAHWLDVEHKEIVVCEDPADVKFVLCAMESSADFIVSGDKHLLKLSGYNDITVLCPSVFVDQFLKKNSK